MTEKKKKSTKNQALRNTFKLYKYIRPFGKEYLLGLFFLIGTSLAMLVFPKLLGDLINTGDDEILNQSLNETALLIGILLIVQSVFSYFRIVLFVNVTEKSLALLRRDTYSHLIKLPIAFFEKRRVGELNSRISADITLLQETLTTTLAEFIRQIIIIVGAIILLAFTSVKLTFFMLLILPPMMVTARFFGRFIRKLSKDMQEKVADSNVVVEETLQGIKSVKAFTNEHLEIERYKTIIQKIAEVGMKSGKYRGAFSSFIILGLFGAISAVVWKGSNLMMAGELSAGDLFSFVIYSVFVGGNIGGLASVFANIQKFIGATEDLFEIFEVNEETIIEVKAIEEKFQLKGCVQFKNLSFAYASRPNEIVLEKVNLEIDCNKVVALVGSSGAGKSTLAALLLMLYEPSKEQLFFDGIDSHDLPLSILRNQIALVPQDIFLFGGTIRENIAYGKTSASETSILDAAEKANAMEFVNRFPEGLDTVVGERGTQLSGGQRQRIAIARAVLKDPKILILDEATSSLDSESEKLVQEALEKLMLGRTSIVIAHRLSTIRKADNIVVLDKGEIAEQGTHQELMQLENGIYKKLSELQFSI